MSRVSAKDRRQEFVNAAVRVIAEHGAPAATTRLIAQEAGAPLASLHYCYDSKQSLFDAVFDALAQRPYDGDALEAGSGLASAVSSVLERAVGWYVERPEWARTRMELFFWAVHAEDGDVAIRAYEAQRATLTALLTPACSRRDDETMIEPVARMVISVMDGLLLQWLSSHDEVALRDEMKRAGDALGLMLEPRRRRAT
jgi:AcrR family transcriptional regulator